LWQKARKVDFRKPERGRNMSTYGIILFHTTSAVLRAEKILLREGLAVKVVPTPREFSTDCGIALRLDWRQAESAKALLESAKIAVASVHQMK
jgi:hypothetical protein